jgi:hypothetical protein
MRRVIWLQLPTVRVFWLGVGTISLSCSMYLGLVMLEIHTAEPRMPELSAFEMAIGKLKRHIAWY